MNKYIIIVGGPPNSGKSTFTVNLVRSFQDQGVDAEFVDLDLWSPTLDHIQGKMTKKKRDNLKRKSVTADEARHVYERLKNASRKHDVIVGDAPGKISKELEHIFKAATHGIVVCRDDKMEQEKVWQDFFNNDGIDVAATIISKFDCDEQIVSDNPIKVILSGLNRIPEQTPVLMATTALLKERLGV